MGVCHPGEKIRTGPFWAEGTVYTEGQSRRASPRKTPGERSVTWWAWHPSGAAKKFGFYQTMRSQQRTSQRAACLPSVVWDYGDEMREAPSSEVGWLVPKEVVRFKWGKPLCWECRLTVASHLITSADLAGKCRQTPSLQLGHAAVLKMHLVLWRTMFNN